MKALIACILISALTFGLVSAQSNISFQEDTLEAIFKLEDGPLLSTDSIKMTNTNEDTIVVDWLLKVDVPQSEYPDSTGYYQDAWSIQVCDELLCYGPVFQGLSEIPPKSIYSWKLNISGSGALGYELTPGEGIATFEAMDTVKQEEIAKFTIKIVIEDNTINITDVYNEKINIYPSPANNFVTIDILENNSIQQLSINNLSGADLITKQINLGNIQQKINISQQPNGLYLLVFKDENGKPLHQKLVNKK